LIFGIAVDSGRAFDETENYRGITHLGQTMHVKSGLSGMHGKWRIPQRVVDSGIIFFKPFSIDEKRKRNQPENLLRKAARSLRSHISETWRCMKRVGHYTHCRRSVRRRSHFSGSAHAISVFGELYACRQLKLS
jgi:hypothetical protein